MRPTCTTTGMWLVFEWRTGVSKIVLAKPVDVRATTTQLSYCKYVLLLTLLLLRTSFLFDIVWGCRSCA